MKTSNTFTLWTVFTFSLLLVILKVSFASLSGSYTIDPGKLATSTNYKDFHSAVTDLDSGKRYDGGKANGRGISGPVVFNIADGSYKEKVDITYIKGSSPTNTITFQSNSKDSSKVILYYPSDFAKTKNYVLQLDSVSFIKFRQLTIERTDTLPLGLVINMLNKFTDDSFIGCRILGVKNTIWTNNPTINLNNYYAGDSGICFYDNLIKYGYNGISYLSNNYPGCGRITMVNNRIDSVTTIGIAIQSNINNFVYSNNIMTNSSGGLSIYWPQNCIIQNNVIENGWLDIIFIGSSTISGNKFINSPVQITTGNGGQNLIYNNFISSNGYNDGMDIFSYGNASIFYNNVVARNNLAYSVELTVYDTGSNVIFENNNIMHSDSGFLLNFNSGSYFPNYSNYNNFYSTNTKPFRSSYGYQSFKDYQAYLSLDTNSTFIDPKFVSDSDLHSTNTTLAGKGIAISGISTDIDGKKRPAKPTIGANELKPLPETKARFVLVKNCSSYKVSFYDSSASTCGDINKRIWDFGDKATDTNKSPTHTYSNSGNYVVKLIASSNGGCTDTFAETITVNPIVKAGFSSNSVVCLGNPIAFTNSSANANSYSWNFGDGIASTLQSPSHPYNSLGTYHVKLKAYSAFGCVDSVTNNVVINALPNALFGISSAGNDSEQFWPADTTLKTYKWSFGDGTTSNAMRPLHLYSAAGYYTVSLTVSNNSGCSQTDTGTIYIPAKGLKFLSAGITAPDSACEGDVIHFYDASASNKCATINKWKWEFGDKGTDTSHNPEHIYAHSGFYTILLSILSSGGCADSVIKVIHVLASPSATFTESVSGLSVKFTSSTSNASSYLWDFGDSNLSNAKNPTHTYPSNGSYEVKLSVTATGGCTATDSTSLNLASTGILENNALDQQINVKIYPNPFNNIFTIEPGGNSIKGLEILDITGRDISNLVKFSTKPSQVNAGDLPAGIYFIKLNFESGNWVGKVVKE